MKKIVKLTLGFIALLIVLGFISCKKYLDKAPGKTLIIPGTIPELQAVLDNHEYMNAHLPYLGEISSDDYFVTDVNYNAASNPPDKAAYIWAADIYKGARDASINDWAGPYRIAFYANVALDGLKKIQNGQSVEFNNVKGGALFFRAFAFYQVATLFCTTYIPTTAATDLGIPLRLSAGIDEPSTRASVEQTYQQIISDLKEAAALLPVVAAIKTRPSKPAAFALLAKTYLNMQDFSRALQYADSCLKYKNELLDFNTLDLALTNPFPVYNTEVLFHATMDITNFVYSSARRIDTVFYNLFVPGDLRIPVYFRTTTTGYRLKATYDASEGYVFAGLALDEVYLIRAECAARTGDLQKAKDDLNKLVSSRWVTGSYTNYTTNDKDELLRIILTERRKELFTRGIRWADLKRLNRETVYAKQLTRRVNGVVYTLPPNDLRYVMPIPPYVIDLTNMPQNPR